MTQNVFINCCGPIPPSVIQLQVPTNFQSDASRKTGTALFFNWSSVLNAEGYEVKLYNSSSTIPSNLLQTKTVASNVNEVSFTALNSNTTYFVTIIATTTAAGFSNSDAAGSSDKTLDVILATPQLANIRRTSRSARITWPRVDNAAFYDVHIYEDAALTQGVTNGSVSQTSVGTDPVITYDTKSRNVMGKTLYYKVVAIAGFPYQDSPPASIAVTFKTFNVTLFPASGTQASGGSVTMTIAAPSQNITLRCNSIANPSGQGATMIIHQGPNTANQEAYIDFFDDYINTELEYWNLDGDEPITTVFIDGNFQI